MTEQLLWSPSQKRIEDSQIAKFQKFCGVEGDYKEFHQYSVMNKENFWNQLMDYFHVSFEGSRSPVLLEEGFNKYTWYQNLKLNFAENLLSNGIDSSNAITFVHESGLTKNISYKDLRAQVASFAQSISDILSPGDVLAAFMPNIPETVISMLACSSVGGIFTSTSCDFGIEGVLDRFEQSKPKILVAAIGYDYNGKYIDLTERLVAIESKLPGLKKLVIVDFLNRGVDLNRFKNAVLFSECLSQKAELSFKKLPFSHPLYIMYSSGTTGKPKCIVHSQGGTLLAHIKELGLHTDLTSNKCIFFFTTCGWMMWNWLVSSLYFGSRIVLYEGSPAYPSPQQFFNIIDDHGINIFGTSPKFLKVLSDTNAKFSSSFDGLETILSTGSPLLPEQYDYVYSNIKKDVLLASISGGTDIIGCFMLGNPTLSVYRGEIQCLGLGMDVAAIDEKSNRIVESEGELVCGQTFPNRPIYFLDDFDSSKITRAYFIQNPNFWTHGDFVKITSRGGVIVYGRSDATLNPGGVRIGTAEIYRQTESFNFIQDSICVGRNLDGDVEVVLFVKMKDGEVLTIERKKQIKEVIKKNTTNRHVPKDIFSVTDIPYTRSGKKVELAVARILQNKPLTNIEAIANPECLKQFEDFRV